jgi:hypothetical protein
MAYPFLYLVPLTDNAATERRHAHLDERGVLRSLKHSNKIVVCQVVIMSTVKEVSRGAQTSGLVRKTTVKTGQNQARCLGHRPIWQRSGGYLHSSHCLFIPGGGVPDSFPAPANVLPIEADPRSPAWP